MSFGNKRDKMLRIMKCIVDITRLNYVSTLCVSYNWQIDLI